MRNQRVVQLTNVRAEKALLGALLRSEHSFWEVSDTIKPTAFTVRLHSEIYATIQDVMLAGGKLTMTVLLSRLPEEDDDLGSVAAYLAALGHNAEGMVADYAEQVAETASRRQLMQIGSMLVKAAEKGEQAAIDMAAEAETGLIDAMHGSAPHRPRRLSDVAAQVVAASLAAKGPSHILPGFDTGLPSIDEILGLILPGDLGFILGSQGEGKSAIAAQIGIHAAQTRPGIMFQLEMTDEQVAARELAYRSKMTVSMLNEGGYDEAEKEKLMGAVHELGSLEFWIHAEPNLSVRQMRAHAMAMKRTRGLGFIIADHLRLIKGDGKSRDRWERQAQVTGDLKILAKELGVAVICLAQRTRTAQRREDPTPQIDDADAPSIEQDGDWVLAVWQKTGWLRRNKPNKAAGIDKLEAWEHEIRRAKDIAEVVTLKLRRGEAFQERKLKWIGRMTRFEEIERG